MLGLFLKLNTLVARAADGEIDLNDLGAGGFAPYFVERNPWWMLVPAAAIALVLLHLKKRKKPR